MEKRHEPVALVDMDGTLADFDGQMKQDLDLMRSPGEPPNTLGPQQNDPPHIEARKNVIQCNYKQCDWWRQGRWQTFLMIRNLPKAQRPGLL